MTKRQNYCLHFLLSELILHCLNRLLDIAISTALELIAGNDQAEALNFIRNLNGLHSASLVSRSFHRIGGSGEVGDILIEVLLGSFLLGVGNSIKNYLIHINLSSREKDMSNRVKVGTIISILTNTSQLRAFVLVSNQSYGRNFFELILIETDFIECTLIASKAVNKSLQNCIILLVLLVEKQTPNTPLGIR